MAPDFSDYKGCLITLISRSGHRYDGILDYVDLNRSVMRLRNVTCYGTEGRQQNGPEILPDYNVYEYCSFQGSEINDVKIKYPPLPNIGEQFHVDPAAFQVRDTNVWNSQSSPSPLVGGRGTLTVPIPYQNTIGHPFRRSYSLPKQNTIGHRFRHTYSLPRQNTIGHRFRHTYSLPRQNTIGYRFRPTYSLPRQNTIGYRFRPTYSSPRQNTLGRQSLTIATHEPNHIATPFRPPYSSPRQNTIGRQSLTIATHEPNHIETPFQYRHSLPMQNTIGRPSLPIPTHEPNHNETPPYISQCSTSTESSERFVPHLNLLPPIGSEQYLASHVSSPSAHITGQSVPNTASSFGGSTSGPPLALPASSLSPYQLSQSGANVPSTMRLSGDPRDLVTPMQLPHNSLGLIDPLEHQAHLLPSPSETRTHITGQSVPNTASSFEDSTSGPPLTLPPSSLGLTDPLEHQAHLLPSPRETTTPITGQSVPNTASSFGDSTSGPSLILPPSSLSPHQLSESGANVPSTVRLCDDPRDLVTLTHLPHNSLELTDPLEHQAPLLPSPRDTPTQQDELLEAEQGNLSEVVEENKTGVRIEEDKSYRAKLMFEPPTSSNTLARGSKRGLNQFTKYIEPTGNLQQTGNPDLGGDGAGRGSNNQSSRG